MPARFLPLADVAEILSISSAQAYALVRSGDLPAIKVGGRGQWRVETTELEDYIARMYSQTRALVERGGLEDAEGLPQGSTQGSTQGSVPGTADGSAEGPAGG